MEYGNFIKFKGNGYYYNVYNDDAYVISNITGYKLFDKNGTIVTGFPCYLLDKVLSLLNENKISYMVDDIIKDYGNLNQYNRFNRKDIFITSSNARKKIFSGSFSICFLEDEKIIETFEIGKTISSDAEIVKIVYDNDINSINTLKSGEKFKIINKNIK